MGNFLRIKDVMKKTGIANIGLLGLIVVELWHL